MWRDIVTEQFRQSIETPTGFFDEYADRLAHASFEMAKRFQRGGRLLVFGDGTSATDAQHVSVEFVHPVIVGKRALPALALTNDVATLSGIALQAGWAEIFARQVRLLGTSHDMALGLAADDNAESVARGLAAAREVGMLTIAMCAGGSLTTQPLDFCFAVAAANAYIVQEIQETAYHILWETVHVFFEHDGLLEREATQ